MFSKQSCNTSAPCAWRSDRYLTLNRGHRITGVTLPFKVNLPYPGLKQLFYINITWEVMGGLLPLPFKSFWPLLWLDIPYFFFSYCVIKDGVDLGLNLWLQDYKRGKYFHMIWFLLNTINLCSCVNKLPKCEVKLGINLWHHRVFISQGNTSQNILSSCSRS